MPVKVAHVKRRCACLQKCNYSCKRLESKNLACVSGGMLGERNFMFARRQYHQLRRLERTQILVNEEKKEVFITFKMENLHVDFKICSNIHDMY